MKVKKILTFLLLLFIIGTIFLLSNQNSKESGDLSKQFAEDVITTVDNVTHIKIEGKQTKKAFIKKNLYVIRKIAHITEYILLSIVLMGFISYYRKIDYKYIIITIAICVGLAIIDEFHQLFVSGRTGKVIDVFIDLIGIVIGTFIYYITYTNGKGKTDYLKDKEVKNDKNIKKDKKGLKCV